MNNRNSQTIRHLGPASTAAILPPVAPSRTCPPIDEGETSRQSPCESESRIAPFAMHNPASGIQDLAPTIEHPESGIQNPVSPIQNPPTPTRASKPKARNGKIARLPKPIRDMVNLMLQNNIPHADIADAIEEHGIRVTVRNISNWKTRGGYNDWRLEQERIVTTRLRQDNLTDYLRPSDASHLPEVGLQLTATQLCEFLLKPETERQLTSNPEKFARTISNLCRVTRHLHLLQKYRDDSARELGYKHNPERVKREIDKQLESTRHIFSAEKLGDTDNEPDIPHRNFIPKNAHSHVAHDDSDQDSARPAVDPLTLLSTITSALKSGRSSRPASSDSSCAA